MSSMTKAIFAALILSVFFPRLAACSDDVASQQRKFSVSSAAGIDPAVCRECVSVCMKSVAERCAQELALAGKQCDELHPGERKCKDEAKKSFDKCAGEGLVGCVNNCFGNGACSPK